MTDEQRRLMHARRKVEDGFLHPLQELLDATLAFGAAEKRRTADAQAVLEALRPVWAQGWTTDSQAAQALAAALAELWQLLGAENQTQAMETLRKLTGN